MIIHSTRLITALPVKITTKKKRPKTKFLSNFNGRNKKEAENLQETSKSKRSMETYKPSYDAGKLLCVKKCWEKMFTYAVQKKNRKRQINKKFYSPALSKLIFGRFFGGLNKLNSRTISKET